MFVCTYCGLPKTDLVHRLSAPTGHHYGYSYEEMSTYKAALNQAEQTADGWTRGPDGQRVRIVEINMDEEG